MRPVLMLSLILASACADETISGYADPSATYRLLEIDGTRFEPRATITFRETGRAAGEAPCNSWSAAQSVPYPWFQLGPIAATRRACPYLAEEERFFNALGQMSLAEVQGPVLILSNDAGREMIFEAE